MRIIGLLFFPLKFYCLGHCQTERFQNNTKPRSTRELRGSAYSATRKGSIHPRARGQPGSCTIPEGKSGLQAKDSGAKPFGVPSPVQSLPSYLLHEFRPRPPLPAAALGAALSASRFIFRSAASRRCAPEC